MREQTEQQHQRKEEREEQRGLHDGLDEQVRRPLRRGNGGIGHALRHAVDGVVGDTEALERVERFGEQIAQLVGAAVRRALRSPSSAASASDGISRSNCARTFSSTLG